MLDLQFIRENQDLIEKNCRDRHIDLNVGRLVELDERRRAYMTELQSVQHERNQQAKSLKGKPTDEQRKRGKYLKERQDELDNLLNVTKSELEILHLQVPNMTHPDVPIGSTDEDNKEIRRVGDIPDFGFKPKDHVELGESLDLLDFEAGAKVAGQKFYYLKN